MMVVSACQRLFRKMIVSEGPFTLQRILGTARIKIVRVPKNRVVFGSDRFSSVNAFPSQFLSVPYQIFYPCSDHLFR